ncbi:hypothetical protein [Prochlorococcus sp. MIT 1300]|uniref:hypothetical protein n=1 Tax=Prochlorococcus sp. MIT 1300 TaxID=3096218 RepID=UPI002A754FD3|nr:hypothetical protein [Prochlorococcus sp. MIT 1300]
MEANQESLFERAMDRYQSGTPAEELIGDFETFTTVSPNQAAGWICLAWLQLLCDQPNDALLSARKAVRIDSKDPQARVNLSLALLETNSKGVRDHIDYVKRVMSILPECGKELSNSIADGLERKPEWEALIKVKNWLEL